MATSIEIRMPGGLTSTLTFADDAKVRAILELFAPPPPSAVSNQQKLDHALREMVNMAQERAYRRRHDALAAAALETALNETRMA